MYSLCPGAQENCGGCRYSDLLNLRYNCQGHELKVPIIPSNLSRFILVPPGTSQPRLVSVTHT
jgi:hypothetical protein